MRLKPEEVTAIVQQLLKIWTQSPHVEILSDPSQLRAELESILIQTLKAEDDLDAEVEKILTKYENEFARGTLDRRKMFQMAKVQLAKEKGIIL